MSCWSNSSRTGQIRGSEVKLAKIWSNSSRTGQIRRMQGPCERWSNSSLRGVIPSRHLEPSIRAPQSGRQSESSIRVVDPNHESESSIRVACASFIRVVCPSHCLVDCTGQRESESSVRVAVCAAVKGRRSESLFRVICPSRRSESSVRDAIPSHPFRLSLRVAFQVAVPSCHSAIPSRLYGPHSELSVRAVVPSYNVCPAVLPGRQSASVAGGAGTCESVRVIPSRQSESHGTCGHGRLSDARAPQSGPG